MEMAVDVTETIRLESGLNFAHTFLETLIATSQDGIIAVDDQDKLSIFNSAARQLFGFENDQKVVLDDIRKLLPEGVLDVGASPSRRLYLPDTNIKTTDEQRHPVRLVGNQLIMEEKSLGMALSIQNLSEIKKLQNEKLEAERLAAVGQTVAGLAHGVKNLITALEGGMYMLIPASAKAIWGGLKRASICLPATSTVSDCSLKPFSAFRAEEKSRPPSATPKIFPGRSSICMPPKPRNTVLICGMAMATILNPHQLTTKVCWSVSRTWWVTPSTPAS
jgi:hypothetical protein